MARRYAPRWSLPVALALGVPLAACNAPADPGRAAPPTRPGGAEAPVPKDSTVAAAKDSPAAAAPQEVPHEPVSKDSLPVSPDSLAPPAARPGDAGTRDRLAPQTVTATGAGAPRTLHLAAIREGDVALHVLTDGSLAVRGDTAFAVATPTARSLAHDPAWLRGLPHGDRTPVETSTVLGGRWPEAAFFSFTVEYDRSGGGYSAYRWQHDRWTDVALTSTEPGFERIYAAYVGGPDGAVLGLRSHALGSDSYEANPARLRGMKKTLARMRPQLDRLDGPDGPRAAGVAPELPVGPAAIDLLSFADGTLIVMRSGPQLQRWSPGASAWKSLPPLGYTATGYYDGPTLVGRDPSRVYVFSCSDAVTEARLHRLVDDVWQPLAPPDGKCVGSLSEDAGGAVWLIAGTDLYHHPAPGPAPGPTPSPDWQPVALSPTIEWPARPAAWRHDAIGGTWFELPAVAARSQQIGPSRVLALGPGELWLTVDAGDSRLEPGSSRKAVLTTRPIDAPISLPDSNRITTETAALEHEPFDRDCYTPLLELGAVTDPPATARPPALADVPLAGLTVVTSESGRGHDVALLWMTGKPTAAEGAATLTALAERLRPAFPKLQLACRVPHVVAVLP